MKRKISTWLFVLPLALAIGAAPAIANTVKLSCPKGTSPQITKIVQTVTADGDWETTIYYKCV